MTDAMSQCSSKRKKRWYHHPNTHLISTYTLIVYFAMYRLILKLSSSWPSSSGNLPRCCFILCAVFHVLSTTSPTRPMAWQSELIILIAPISCNTSSAAIVSARIRLSANATSSGIVFDKWWHTINMSMCSSSVLAVKGRVGLVEEGNTLGSEHTLITKHKRVNQVKHHSRQILARLTIRGMSAASTLTMVSVNSSPLESANSRFNKASFVQCIRMNSSLFSIV